MPAVRLSKTEHTALLLLSRYPRRQFYSSQVAQLAGTSIGGTHLALRQLTARKLIAAERKGRMTFYQVKAQHPVVKQLKVTETVSQLTRLVERLKGLALEVILFGSAARGEQTAESDVDIFILTHQVAEVHAVIARERRGMPLAAVVKTPQQWMTLERTEPEFSQEVRRGILLHHGDAE